MELNTSYVVFYLLVGRVWNKLAFKRLEGMANLYLAAGAGAVVDVAVEEGSPRPLLQFLVEDIMGIVGG
jgi:hypothetical protein